jgi:hypothetical protein
MMLVRFVEDKSRARVCGIAPVSSMLPQRIVFQATGKAEKCHLEGRLGSIHPDPSTLPQNLIALRRAAALHVRIVEARDFASWPRKKFFEDNPQISERIIVKLKHYIHNSAI